MTTRILVDGDWIVYTAGFAGQKTEYVYDADGAWVRGSTMTALKETVGGAFNADNVYSRIVVDPIEHVLHSAKMMLTRAVASVIERVGGTEAEPTVFIDGDGNFRQKIATIRPYKGNRVAAKPVMYTAIREYLQEQWAAELVHDQETDDALSVVAHAERGNVAIVGVDKDLLQIPALHYNPNKGFCKITPELGEALVYRQCLTGDVTDNIGGCYKVGDKRAHAVVTSGMTAAEKWAAVLAEYAASIDKYGEGLYNGLTAEQAATENMRLVWLRRFGGEVWTPPV